MICINECLGKAPNGILPISRSCKDDDFVKGPPVATPAKPVPV
jgi:hypothetical protein